MCPLRYSNPHCSYTFHSVIFVRLANFWATVCRPMPSDRCLSVLSCPVCDVGVLWPNGWRDQDESWYAGRTWPWPQCVTWRPRPRLPKGHSPQFSAHICCGQMALWIKMPLNADAGLDPSDIVLDGDPAAPPKRGTAPIFTPCLL